MANGNKPLSQVCFLRHNTSISISSLWIKMAEVGQRLRTGAYRLTTLRENYSRSTVPGESSGDCASNVSWTNTEVIKDQRTMSKRRATQDEKVHRLNSRSASSLVLEAPRCIACIQAGESLQAHKTALLLSTRTQLLTQEKLVLERMASWTTVPVSSHPSILGSPQQLRAFCTRIFILSGEASVSPSCRRRRMCLKLHPDTLQSSSTCRCSSWRSDSNSKHVPPLYRNKTAYYDILRVSPGATQSQIKTAYYKQSFIYHPDKNPGSDEAKQRFSEISEAYTVLGSISLRRKYDRGILSHSDVHSAGRPSSKETPSKPKGTPQQQWRARQYSQAGGKPMFDFDTFYRAHYGEQLQREQDLKARKQRMEELKRRQQEDNHAKKLEATVAMLLATALIIFVSVFKS